MISDELREKMIAAGKAAHQKALADCSQEMCGDEHLEAFFDAVLPMIVEKCAEAAEGNALQWINGEATTSYGQAYQAGSRGAATAIRSLARP